jgi:SAM-dependent methyltransferase
MVKKLIDAANQPDFLTVTERGGEPVSQAQLERFFQRYIWACTFAKDKEVLELACGTGPGLGHLQKVSKRLLAADISEQVLSAARAYYGQRIDLRQLDACNTGLDACSFDIIILFEAIYYLPDVDAFFTEVARLLRPGGQLLLATANKDLFDFNPSRFSHCYYSPPDLEKLLQRRGFETSFFGGSPVAASGIKTRLLRAAKRIAARYRFIPDSMNGKRLLKRLVFGPLVPMPLELDPRDACYIEPQPIPADQPDISHQVIYCIARKL